MHAIGKEKNPPIRVSLEDFPAHIESCKNPEIKAALEKVLTIVTNEKFIAHCMENL